MKSRLMRSFGWLIFDGRSGFFSHWVADITDVNAKPLCLHIDKKKLKGFAYGWKRYLVPWDLAGGEKAGLQGFFSGAELPVFKAGAIEHVNLVDMRHIDDGVKAFDGDVGKGLFQRFPRCSLNGCLGIFHETGGQGPIAVTRLDRAPA